MSDIITDIVISAHSSSHKAKKVDAKDSNKIIVVNN